MSIPITDKHDFEAWIDLTALGHDVIDPVQHLVWARTLRETAAKFGGRSLPHRARLRALRKAEKRRLIKRATL